MRALLLLLFGCGPSAQTYVTYPATAQSSPFVSMGEWTVALSDARIAFGPVYFCAASSAKPELCETALAEITQVSTIDLLGGAVDLGDVYGLTGEIRSVNFDYGVSWLPTQNQATPWPEAPEGHSAVFRGTASKGVQTLRFEALIDVTPSARGIRAALGARTGATITGDNAHLQVTFEPSLWISTVDFDELFAKGGDPVRVTPDMQAYTALVTAMQANFPPIMRWRMQ